MHYQLKTTLFVPMNKKWHQLNIFVKSFLPCNGVAFLQCVFSCERRACIEPWTASPPSNIPSIDRRKTFCCIRCAHCLNAENEMIGEAITLLGVIPPDDWWSRGREFESLPQIQDWSFFTFLCCYKRQKVNEKRPGMVHITNLSKTGHHLLPLF